MQECICPCSVVVSHDFCNTGQRLPLPDPSKFNLATSLEADSASFGVAKDVTFRMVAVLLKLS